MIKLCTVRVMVGICLIFGFLWAATGTIDAREKKETKKIPAMSSRERVQFQKHTEGFQSLKEVALEENFEGSLKTITSEISAVKTNKNNVDGKQLVRIASMMSQETQDPDQLKRTLLQFYALNAHDLEIVLIKIRELNRPRIKEKIRNINQFEMTERYIQAACRELNGISLKRYKVPFHLAAVNYKLDFIKKVMEKNGIKPHDAQVKDDKPGRNTRASCPMDSYPRYVQVQWPWKLRLSLHISTRQRQEDVGCHYDHGAFEGKIRGWVSFSPRIWGMISLNGWDWRLAANDRHLFYKWWSLVPFGLTPVDCMNKLYARIY